jgi:starch synthase/alpha-amylase
VEHLDADRGTGNGFVFKHYDSQGLSWAMDQAMAFYKLPQAAKRAQIQRIMTQSAARFTHEVCARQYIDLYEKMLQRPLIVGQGQGA